MDSRRRDDQLIRRVAMKLITCGNALRLDWLSICPPTGTTVKLVAEDLFETPLEQAEIDFENEGGETYICGNPPYVGDKKQNKSQKADIKLVFEGFTKRWKSLDYICGFFFKAAKYNSIVASRSAFVATNSISQGQHVSLFWKLVLDENELFFANLSFKWANLAAHNAGVTCVILGMAAKGNGLVKRIFNNDNVKIVKNISPYLTDGSTTFVIPSSKPITELSKMTLGNVPKDGGNLLMSAVARNDLGLTQDELDKWTKLAIGSTEFIQGKLRYCLWIVDEEKEIALKNNLVAERVEKTRLSREQSVDPGMAEMARRPYQFREMNIATHHAIVVPRVSSENRPYLPTGIINETAIITDRNYALYDAPLWNMALISSRLHWVWIGTVCVRMRTDFSYSNTLGWNTFPVPKLTEKNNEDLTHCAEDILLAREAHFPATIADLYEPDNMPEDLRHAHERNDEVLERIYIGRKFKNDTERLETLFEMYTKMTTDSNKIIKNKKKVS